MAERHPQPPRFDDSESLVYDEDEACSCGCHRMDEEDDDQPP